MLVMYNERLNLFGICDNGWEYVAVQHPVWVATIGSRHLNCTYVEQIYLLDSSWQVVSTL